MSQVMCGYCRKCKGKLLAPGNENKRYAYCNRCPFKEEILIEESKKVRKYIEVDRELQ